jgi:hypothetical protein
MIGQDPEDDLAGQAVRRLKVSPVNRLSREAA